MAGVICDNTAITAVPKNAFVLTNPKDFISCDDTPNIGAGDIRELLKTGKFWLMQKWNSYLNNNFLIYQDNLTQSTIATMVLEHGLTKKEYMDWFRRQNALVKKCILFLYFVL